jgi:hypothetical protein
MSDLVINIFVGVPTGFLTYGLICSRRPEQGATFVKSILSLLLFVFFCSFFGCFVELGQGYFSGRDSSFSDSILQILGSAIGLAVWRHRVDRIEGICKSVSCLIKQMDGLDLVTGGFAMAFVFLQVWPLIPAVSPSELWEKVKQLNKAIFQEDWVEAIFLLDFNSKLLILIGFIFAMNFGLFFSRVGYKFQALSFKKQCVFVAIFIIGLECSKLAIQDRAPSMLSFVGSLIGAKLGLFFGGKRWAR